jgi:outer membrane receptor protein involved in Fe transport
MLLVAVALLASPAEADGLGDPAPDQRPRPPEPPPPGSAIPGWDLDPFSDAAGLGPPLPPPDPWLVRPLLYRHDRDDVSMDGRIKEPKRIPQWVDVIRRTEIAEWRPMNLGGLARRLPNVMVGDGGSPFLELPNIRGFGGDRVKIMTDGVWPTSQSLGFFGGSLSLWDPESTDHVEVFHGPGAYLKAIDSPGGMINVVPRRPRRHGPLSADVGASTSFDSATSTFRERAEVDVGQDRLAALAGFTWTTVGNRDTGDGTLRPSDYDQYALDLAADYFLSNRSTIGATAQLVRATNVRSPLSAITSADQPAYERFFVALSLTAFEVGDVFHGSRVSIAIDSFLQDDDRTVSDEEAGIASETGSDRFDFHLEGSLALIDCHTTWAEIGVSYAHLDRTETLLCVPDTRGGGGNEIPPGGQSLPSGNVTPEAVLGDCVPVSNSFEAEEWRVTGLLQDEYHDPCWDWMGGVRVDYYHVDDDRVGNEDDRILVGGAAGIARHFDIRTTGYTNVSFGWRAPTLYELHSTEIVDGRPLFGNPDLDPEIHANLEFGVKRSLKDRASVQAAVFGHYTDDFIGPFDLGALGAELRNLGDAVQVGGELAAAWRPLTTLEGLELFTTWGTTISTDEDVVADVPLLGRAGARYSVPQPQGYRIRRWFGELSFHGATDSNDGPRGDDPYVTADLVLGTGLDFHCRKAGWINFGLTNLLDVDYVPPGAILPAAGLSFFASLAVEF